MSETDVQVRELLQAKAEEMRLDPRIPRPVLRRARRRRVATAVVAGMVAVGVALGGVAGLRASLVAEPPVAPGQGPWRGIWPQDTRADAEAAQEAADAGDPDAVWQLDGEEVIRRYGVEVLEWETVHFEQDPWEADTLVVAIGNCPRVATKGCPFEVDITVERLVRKGPGGVFVVTEAEVTAQYTGDAPRRVRNFVEAFMEARAMGSASLIKTFLSARTWNQFRAGENGLSLYGPTDEPAFLGLDHEVVSVGEQEHLGHYGAEVDVIHRFAGREDVVLTESLSIGPGRSYGGDDLPLVVRGASVIFPEPGSTEGEAKDLVAAFLDDRLAGSGAERFLTEVAAQQYASHEGGLYLYGEEHDPGLGWNYAGGGVVSVQAVDANSFEVVVALSLERDGDHRTIHETLFVGPEEIGLMIRGAVRNDG
jgi:hypothetical protein